jgi:hypothetical protein
MVVRRPAAEMSCISRTKTSSILNKNYTEMRKERDIRGNDY